MDEFFGEKGDEVLVCLKGGFCKEELVFDILRRECECCLSGEGLLNF